VRADALRIRRAGPALDAAAQIRDRLEAARRVPELLTRPTRDESQDELAALYGLRSRLDLRPVDPLVAELAVVLGAAYRLKAAEAVHLATAVNAGADRFVTNNARDFMRDIDEIDITYPDDLPAPPSRRSKR
jgi:predicted nucleic acid-binding protein